MMVTETPSPTTEVSSRAGWVVGDEFRLIFLSSIKRSATSSNIDDYNTFVQNLAAAGHAEIQAYRLRIHGRRLHRR